MSASQDRLGSLEFVNYWRNTVYYINSHRLAEELYVILLNQWPFIISSKANQTAGIPKSFNDVNPYPVTRSSKFLKLCSDVILSNDFGRNK